MAAGSIGQIVSTLGFLSLFGPRIYDWYQVARAPVELHQKVFDEDNYNVPEGRWLEYDFVVVGAGASGSVVAARLAEIYNWTVLLVESGPGETYNTSIPAYGFSGVQGSLSWNYQTVPQKTSGKGFKENRIAVPAGHVIGGSATIGATTMCRGQLELLREVWEKQFGVEKWGFDETWNFFKSMENYMKMYPSIKERHIERGIDGPMTVTNALHEDKEDDLVKAWMELGGELGYKNKHNDYIVQEDRLGFFPAQLARKGPYKWSSANAFLNPEELKVTPNLTVVANTHASKLLVSLTSGEPQVTGVEVHISNGADITYVMARKEVIVAAGALNTPKLLLQSGIGPKADNEKKGIPTFIDLPGVGRNLRDRPSIYPLTFKVKDSESVRAAFDSLAVDGTGPMTKFSTGIAFIRLDDVKDKAEFVKIPHCQLNLYQEPAWTSRFLQEKFNFGFDAANALGAGATLFKNSRTFSLGVTLVRPRSRGHVTVASRNPHAAPEIDPKYYSFPDDLETHAKCVRKAVQIIAESDAFRSLGAQPAFPKLTECGGIETRSLEHYKCLLEHLAMSSFDYAGTARMGNTSDPTTVVDSRLRIIGLERVRIADASIMPEPLGCSAYAASTMIGEKVAEFLIEDWKDHIVPRPPVEGEDVLPLPPPTKLAGDDPDDFFAGLTEEEIYAKLSEHARKRDGEEASGDEPDDYEDGDDAWMGVVRDEL